MQIIVQKIYEKAVAGLTEEVLENADRWYNYVLQLPTDMQIAYSVILFHNQVFNGGLHQYFFNSFGQFAYLTLENLRKIKAYHTADILQMALSRVNDKKPTVEDFRENIVKRRLEKVVNFDSELEKYLNELDRKYYDIDENLELLLQQFFSEPSM